MKKTILILLIGVFTLSLSSCAIDFTMKLKPDGSGQFVQKVMMNKAMLAMLEGMGSKDSTKTEDPKKDMFEVSDEKIAEKKAEIAEKNIGMKLETMEMVEDDVSKGVMTVYSFEDVTKLNKALEEEMSNDDEESEEGEKFNIADSLNIQFNKKGGYSELVINHKMNQNEMLKNQMLDGDENKSLKQAMQMMGNTRVRLAIEIDGEIVECNSPNREGNTIYFMEIDYGKMSKDPEFEKKLNSNDPNVKIQGLSFPTTDKTVIKFK